MIGFTRTLSKDRRYAIWQATREERRALRPLRMEVRKARTEARTVFTAEPFDRQRFAEAQARVQEAEAKARAEAHKLFIAVASVLTPEERAAFAKWEPAKRAERMRMWRRGWSGDDGKAATAPAQPR